ncbi:MAG: hypothetical protein M3552_15200 [Planctomycetota bacterium]|nr:hypothetical protein [Planctomycetaceae bacterium]MDQ3331977.1 hypothetical protein [Planctomycetota bacterium]
MPTPAALRISDRITCLPVIHGSGDFAVEVRRVMLDNRFDCLAVPLPPSFQEAVTWAVNRLPGVTAVVQPEPRSYDAGDWSPEGDGDEPSDRAGVSYVPIDPCQPVIAALRIASQEHMAVRFVDPETAEYEAVGMVLPDPYALKRVQSDRFAAAVLPVLPRLEGQAADRCIAMANRLRELEARFQSILFVCSIAEWPWVKEAYHDRTPQRVVDEEVEDVETYAVAPNSLAFFLGELPYITGLYEQARNELDPDENLSIDGIKALLLEARDRYKAEFKGRARKITPKLAATYFQYVRNLSLVDRRLTPDLYTLIVAAQQIFGDALAITLAETAREYPFPPPVDMQTCKMGLGKLQLPDGEIVEATSRLPGPPVFWRSLSLTRRAPKIQQDEWRMRWNPFRQCSWPPEDNKIENFRTHVKDMALAMLGADLARSEKFTTSIMDGLDIRETLRNWHTRDIYVKVLPPSRGNLDSAVMLFDSPADPREYPWRMTWHAEHQNESTLCFFATNYLDEIVGPGVGQATYGGCLFLFPPRPVPDVWQDPRFDFADTLEERLLAAGCYHSEHRHVAILSDSPPGAGFRRLARKFGKKLVHVPLSRLSQETVSHLRVFHVLNGHEVRSYAAHFIREA